MRFMSFSSEIYQNIGSRNNFSDEEIEDVRLAIKNAARGVTMTFLGMVKVFEADQDKVHDTEGLLCDGWSFIREFYTSWNTMEHKDFGFGTKSLYETDLSYDPYFHLRYLKQPKRSNHIPIALTHSISLLWSKYRGQSKIPKDLFEHWEQVENVAQIDSTSIQGGLYGRLKIRSISFWGLEEFTRTHWYLNRETYINSKDIWSWASDAAQFHTSVGREACKDLHTFFEDLLQKLHINYNNNLKQVDPSPMLKAKSNNLSNDIHAEHLDMIVRAISIAEYRVTVPFIGIVRSLNENDLTSDQLQKLLDNATGFLKDKFSQWNQLDFRHQNVQDLFSYQPVPKKIHSSMETYETMFRCLSGFADKNTFPSRMILNLLKLWRQSTTTIRLSSENDSPFPISDIPDVYSDALQTRFAELLADHDSKSPRNIHNNVDNFKPSNPSVIYRLLREAFAIKGSEELDTDFDGFVQ
ncbi:hypothetical protein DFH28DRAFT_96083 [Melampsora americana]|nr:hypothetical protein DFH28DRAFT_96083 [Melampsora americana]